MSPTTTAATEEKLTLPSGHPQAGYVSPDRSYAEGIGTLPPDEQEAREELIAAREDEAEAIAAAEDKVAKAEAKAAEEAAKAETTTTSKTDTSTKS